MPSWVCPQVKSLGLTPGGQGACRHDPAFPRATGSQAASRGATPASCHSTGGSCPGGGAGRCNTGVRGARDRCAPAALSSLSAGGFCIPLYIPYVLTGEWKFGKGLCKLWLVVDYLVCTASVFNIVLISFDRFISVTKAVRDRALLP